MRLGGAIPTTNQAASVPHFRYDQAMTIGITGPGRKAPRQSGVVRLIVAAVVITSCLILLSLASDFLVDWLWFSSIGYLQVFLTAIGATFFSIDGTKMPARACAVIVTLLNAAPKIFAR